MAEATEAPQTPRRHSIEHSREAVARIQELVGRFQMALARRSVESGITTDDAKMTPAHVDAAVEQATKDILNDADWTGESSDA